LFESIEPDDGAVERSVELPASASEVWEALTAPAGLSAWLGGEVLSLDVGPGGRGLVRRGDGAVRRVVVEEVETGRRLRFRWWPYSRPDMPSPLGSTIVEFRLEEHGPTTTLRVIERPPLTNGGRPPRPGAEVEADPDADAVPRARLVEALAR